MLPFLLAAAEAPAADLAPRPRVGLALSGGGARGLAHIGVLKVLDEAGIPVDVVAGTSIGSIVGALYSIGYSPAEIERIVLGADWNDLLSDRLERGELPMKNRKKEDRYLFSFPVVKGRPRLPAGLVSGQKIYNLFVRLAWPVLEVKDFRTFPRPFACVAVDLASGSVVVLDHGYLPDALRASMSIPSIFTPVRLGGRVLVDGGLLRNLPAEDARALGADVVIGVDVGDKLLPVEDLETLADVMNQAIEIERIPDHEKQRRLCDVLVVPDLDGYTTRDYARAREIIALGEAAAREHLEELRALADPLGARAGVEIAEAARSAPGPIAAAAGAGPVDTIPVGGVIAAQAPPCAVSPGVGLGSVSCAPVRVDEIEVRGLHDVSSRFVLSELGVRTPTSVTVDQLERAILRLYSSGFFSELSYRFEPSPAGRKLVVVVQENSGVLLNTGLRYDSRAGPVLLVNGSIMNAFGHGSTFETDLILSDRKRLTGEYALHTGIRRSVGLRADADYIDDHVDDYVLEERVSRWRVRSTRAGAFLETLLSSVLYAAAGMNAEWYRTSPEIAPPEQGVETGRIAFASGDLWFDTLDRSWFPRRGFSLRIRGEAAGGALGGDASFDRAHLAFTVAVPVERRVTLAGRAFIGVTDGGPAPSHYRFFIGGINSFTTFQGDRTFSFYGYDDEELSGANAFAAGVDLQVEAAHGWYAVLHANAGATAARRADLFERDAVLFGVAASLGAETRLGPAELSLTYSKRDDLGWFLSIGFPF
jgi:NTE family protein